MADTNVTNTLVVVDVVGTQDYIFASNRLAENLVASYLVKQVTGAWAIRALNGMRHNVNGVDAPLTDARIEQDNALDAEVLYLTSGSFLVLFRNKQQAKDFTTALTKRVHEEAPGLRIVVHHVAFDWANESLADAVGYALSKGVKKTRYEEAYVTPLLGLGVTRMCASTALPVVGRVDRGQDKRDASAEVIAKMKASGKASEELRRQFGVPSGYDLPNDLDNLGRSAGENNFIAVVHADGTGVGKRVVALADNYRTPSQNRAYLTHLRAFSEALDEAALAALKSMFGLLMDSVQGSKFVGVNGEDFALARDKANENIYLPFRPIVYGGDDLTFVCDGRIGLALATHYLRAFARETEERFGKGNGFTAGAGIAIVKSRFPFARAYALADEMASSAKSYARHNANGGLPPSALDWHFSISGFSADLDALREREYQVAAGNLILRSVLLGTAEDAKVAGRTWAYVDTITRAFQGPDWSEKRNKAKALRDAVRGGPGEVHKFTSIYNQTLPGAAKDGWANGVCTVFDALEIADLHIPLEASE